MQKVIDQAGHVHAAPIGLFTSQDRDSWYQNRSRLIEQHPNHAETLKQIEAAAFVICLDDFTPATRHDLSRACWHGEGANRWFDKSIQFIVFENGRAGTLNEHSMMDGTTTLRLNDFICQQYIHFCEKPKIYDI